MKTICRKSSVGGWRSLSAVFQNALKPPFPTLLTPVYYLQHFTAHEIPPFTRFSIRDIRSHCPQNSNVLTIQLILSGSFSASVQTAG